MLGKVLHTAMTGLEEDISPSHCPYGCVFFFFSGFCSVALTRDVIS